MNLDQELNQQNYIIENEIVLNTDNKQILIVEDNDDLREYIVGLFSKKYKVLEARNGKEGLEIAREKTHKNRRTNQPYYVCNAHIKTKHYHYSQYL